MKHKRTGRTLGRNATTRKQLWRNLASSLLTHGSVVTTRAKAKDLRGFFEPLVSRARGDMTLAKRRLLLKNIRKDDLPGLIKVAKAQEKRPGGYLRLTRLPRKRLDGSEMVKVDILYE
ncbi:MAG: bL17 family ribosomal protein [bacterium]